MRLFLVLLLLLSADPAGALSRSPGTTFRDAPFAPLMIVVPAGRATLGSTEAETTREGRAPATAAFEHPQRKVAFANPFAVGRSHVTVAQFAAFARATHRPMDGCVVAIAGKWSEGPRPGYSYANPGFAQAPGDPALCVNWADASAYTVWLSAKTQARYRLLTEDEWEYAARGGTTTARWWGDGTSDICTRANGGDRRFAAFMPSDKSANASCDDGYTFTNPPGRFAANPFGLSDMLGNAWQWTADCFAATPATAPSPGDCKARSIRGGSWHNSVSTLRAAARFSLPPAMRSSSLGFRVMRELP